MIEHVWERASKSQYLSSLLVATDDERIASVAVDDVSEPISSPVKRLIPRSGAQVAAIPDEGFRQTHIRFGWHLGWLPIRG